eukprot:19451-Heterococcus_DN1.PRE.1
MTGSDLQAASSSTCMLCAKTKCCERSAAGSRDFGNHLFVFASHAAIRCSSLDQLPSTAQATPSIEITLQTNKLKLPSTLPPRIIRWLFTTVECYWTRKGGDPYVNTIEGHTIEGHSSRVEAQLARELFYVQVKAKEWTPSPSAAPFVAKQATSSGSSAEQQPSPAAAVAVESADASSSSVQIGTAADTTSSSAAPALNGSAATQPKTPPTKSATPPVKVSPLKSPKQPAVAVAAAAQRTRSRSPGAAAAAARSRSHSPLPAAAKSSSGSSPKGEDVDPVTTRKLYDIADLLSMRPAEPSRPSALNPPADLNI